MGVVEQGVFGQPRGGQGGQRGGGQQHVHHDDLVADRGERVDPGDDQAGHRAGQADQADDLGGVDRGQQRGAQRGALVGQECLAGR
ncbi:MAG TPA: hypothetical protein VGL06_21665 [Pseudonocardiaceae bacterium]